MDSDSSSKTEYTSDESIFERGFGIPVKKRKARVSITERKMLINLYERIKKAWPADKYSSLTAMLQRTSEVSGINEYTLYPILKEIIEPKLEKTNILKKSSPEVTRLKRFEKAAIIKLVHDFYLQGDMPTIYRIYYALRDNDNLPNVSMKTLKYVLRRLRFKYLIDNNTVLLQSNGASLRRINYIQNVLKSRKEKKKIFFVDKLTIMQGTMNNDRNQYLTVVIAGNEEWFLEGTGWVLQSHENKISPTNFETWFSKVLGSFENGVVVMKKASYNSRLADSVPTKVWPKEDIKMWLSSKNVTIPPEVNNKACFLSLVEQVKHDHKTYAIEQIAKSKGVTVLWLPKYHDELSPFEFAWPAVKTYIVNNLNPSVLNIASGKFIVMSGLTEVTGDKWKQYIEKVKNTELTMLKLDEKIDHTTESYLKFVGNPRFPGDEISSETSDSEPDSVM